MSVRNCCGTRGREIISLGQGPRILGPDFTKDHHLWTAAHSTTNPHASSPSLTTCWPACSPSYKMEPEPAAQPNSLGPKELRGVTDGRLPEVIFIRLLCTRIRSWEIPALARGCLQLWAFPCLVPRVEVNKRQDRLFRTMQAFPNPSQQMQVPATSVYSCVDTGSGGQGSPVAWPGEEDGRAASPSSTGKGDSYNCPVFTSFFTCCTMRAVGEGWPWLPAPTSIPV